MKKKKVFVFSLFLILVFGGIFLYYFLPSHIEPPKKIPVCHGFSKVGEFDEIVDSSKVAKLVATDYYKSIGMDFTSDDLVAKESVEGWRISFDYSRIGVAEMNWCNKAANPPQCIGKELILQERSFSSRNILMEYSYDC